MVAEVEYITRNKTWELEYRPPGVKTIGLKWIYKIKRKADGTGTSVCTSSTS